MVRMPNKAETPARVQELERRVRELFASADQSARTAQSCANTAQSTATTAQSTATTAQSTAATAQTTAQTAQTTASTANTAAQTAQTAAQQASTDAANANTNASTAQTAAQTAQQQAQAAQQAAAAKTKTTWSTAVPDNTGNPGTAEGDVWYVTNGTGGNATAQYRWSASSSTWALTPIDGTALRNVVADSIKAGAIDGQTITGAFIAGGSLSTTPNPQSPGSGTVEIRGASATFRNSSTGFPHYAFFSMGDSADLRLSGFRALNTAGTSYANYDARFGAPTRLFSSWASPIIGSNRLDFSVLGYVECGLMLTTGIHVGLSTTPSATSPAVSIKSDGTVKAKDYQLPDGTSISADSGWLTPTVATGNGYSVNTLRYRKIGNRVEWTGQLNRSSNMASLSNVITVPAAYAPSVPSGGTTRIFSATGTSGTSFRFNFNTSGQIDIRDIANGTTTYAILDGITYLTD